MNMKRTKQWLFSGPSHDQQSQCGIAAKAKVHMSATQCYCYLIDHARGRLVLDWGVLAERQEDGRARRFRKRAICVQSKRGLQCKTRASIILTAAEAQ